MCAVQNKRKSTKKEDWILNYRADFTELYELKPVSVGVSVAFVNGTDSALIFTNGYNFSQQTVDRWRFAKWNDDDDHDENCHVTFVESLTFSHPAYRIYVNVMLKFNAR